MNCHSNTHLLTVSLGFALVLAATAPALAQEGIVFPPVDNAGDVGQYTSIALDGDNRPHISYYDVTNEDLKYAKKLEDGSWACETVDATGNVGRYTSLAMCQSFFPFISYYRGDGVSEDLKLAYFEGGSWEIRRYPAQIVRCESTALAVANRTITPIIAHFDEQTQQIELAMYDYERAYDWVTNADDWAEEWVAAGGWAQDLAMAYTNKDEPRIVFADDKELWYAWKMCLSGCLEAVTPSQPTGDEPWHYARVVAASATFINSVSLAARSDDIAYIAYCNGGALTCVTGHLTIDTWTEDNVQVIDDSSSFWESDCAIALGPDFLPHVCYSTGDGALKYSRLENGNWTDPITVDSGGVGRYNSIAVDSFGNAHISYYDESNGNLKYALVRTGPAVDIMLVLDLSGSMRSPACPSGCAEKREILADAVELFCQIWRTIAITGDQGDHIGAVYFKTNVTAYNDGTVLPVGQDTDNIIADLRSRIDQIVASDLTAMGGGLQLAINRLRENPARPPRIILFTDGMQNVNPMVLKDAAGVLRIDHDPTENDYSNIDPTEPDPTTLDTDLGIKISTIGVGAPDSYMSLLNDIAAATDGVSKFTSAPDDELRRFYVENLVWALQERSPQLVDYRYGRLPSWGGWLARETETFPVGATARQVLLKLSWQRGRKLDFRVLKDGVDLTGAGRVVEGPFYKIWVVDTPIVVDGQTVSPGGDWNMEISGRTGTSYEVAAIVDEHGLRYHFDFDRTWYPAGELIELQAYLSIGGRPVSDAHVTAEIIRPTQSLGTFLSTKPMPPKPSGLVVEPAPTLGLAKFERLQMRSSVSQWLKPVGTTVELEHRGKGMYSASFSNTTTPGAYTVVFHVEGSHADMGQFHRTDTLCTPVLFDQVDFQRSDLRVSEVDVTPTELSMDLSFRPVDPFGNFLGPDYGDEIQVSLSAGDVQAQMQDNGDGSYSVPLQIPKGADPQVTITVRGNVVYEGPLSELAEPDGP